MEIDSGYILNITSVSISTYTDKSSVTEKAILIPTTTTQSTVSSKAAFYLHNSYTLSLTEALDNSEFSGNEKGQLTATKRYMKVVRSSITFSNVNVMHTDFSSNSASILIDLMYLQDKKLTITNCNFNVSGVIAQSFDPLGIHLENIFIDIWALDIAFDFIPSCGYPEANLTSGIVMRNITTDCSIFTTEVKRPRVIFYSGPGNVLVDTMYLPNSYSNILSFAGAFYLSVETVCQLTDAEPRNVDINNVYMSMPENPYGLFYNLIAFRLELDFYRTNVVSLSNFTAEGFDMPPIGYLILSSAMNAEVTYADSVHRNYRPFYSFVQIYWAKSVTLRNLTFENCYDAIEPTIDLGEYETAILEHITFRNYSIVPGTFYGIIDFVYGQDMYTNITNLYFYDVNSGSSNLIWTYLPYYSKYFYMSNSVFHNITSFNQGSLMDLGKMMLFSFSNITFSDISTTGSGVISPKILETGSLDVSAEGETSMKDITIINSAIDFASFGVFENESVGTKNILFQNISFIDSVFPSGGNLISTRGMTSDQNINITYDQLTFRNITYGSSGRTFDFGHLIELPVTIQYSTFENLKSASLFVSVSADVNTKIFSKVNIRHSTFSNIENNINGFINAGQNAIVNIHN